MSRGQHRGAFLFYHTAQVNEGISIPDGAVTMWELLAIRGGEIVNIYEYSYKCFTPSKGKDKLPVSCIVLEYEIAIF